MKKNQVSRVIGGIWIITSILWAGFSLLGLIYGLKWLENTQSKLDANLQLLTDSLGSVENLVAETTDTISATHQSLETIGQSSKDAAATLTDMRPLIWKTTKVITEDVPNALDGVQDSMPSLIETAKTVDQTLSWIADFQIVIPIPLTTDYVFDFGVNYSPEVPLDQALDNLSGNLEGVPDNLRAMEEDLDNLDANLLVIRDDIFRLSGDIDTLNNNIAGVIPRISILIESISEMESSISEIQSKLPRSFEIIRNILMAVMGMILLTQLPSCYMGWLLASGNLIHLNEK